VAADKAATILQKKEASKIYAFIRGYIGGFGRMLMDFYIANSFVINAIILVYGACVYLAHISYLKAYRFILTALGLKLDNLPKGKTGYSKLKLDFEKVNWKQARQTYWFPLISHPKSIGVSLKTNATLRKLFSQEKLKLMLKPTKTQ